RLGQAAPTLLTLPQRLLGPLMFGNVGAGAEPLDDLARGVPYWYPAGGEPAIRAIRAADAVFHCVIALFRYSFNPAIPGAFPVVRMQQLHPAPGEQFALSSAGVFHDLGAEVVGRAVGPCGPYKLRQRLGQAAPTLLALPQRLLGTLAFRNVPHQGHHEPSATFTERL